MLERLLDTDTGELPFLDGALRRHIEEFPAASNGLSRTERQILEVLDSRGSLAPDQLFRAAQTLEDRVYMGDASFWVRVIELAAAPAPLLELRGLVPRSDRLPAGEAEITPLGRDVLRGGADRIRLKGIDRWLGGAHLETRGAVWRWNESHIVESQ
jgi:hypothetical protein